MDSVAVIELSEDVSGRQNDEEKSLLPSTSQHLSEAPEVEAAEHASSWRENLMSCWNACGRPGEQFRSLVSIIDKKSSLEIGPRFCHIFGHGWLGEVACVTQQGDLPL